MDISTYEQLIKSESTARKYLLGYCWKNHQPRRWRGHQRFCPHCRGRKLYKLGDGRRRCARCRYTFHDFTRRWINTGGLTPGQWLRIIKLFELELSTRKIATQLGLAYNTAYKAVHTIRRAILAHSQDFQSLLGGEVELDESYFGGHRPQAAEMVNALLDQGKGDLDHSALALLVEQLGGVEIED